MKSTNLIEIGCIFVPANRKDFIANDKFIRCGTEGGLWNFVIGSEEFEEKFIPKKEKKSKRRKISYHMFRKGKETKDVLFVKEAINVQRSEVFLSDIYFILKEEENTLIWEGRNLFLVKNTEGVLQVVCVDNTQNIKEIKFKEGWTINSYPLEKAHVSNGDQVFIPKC